MPYILDQLRGKYESLRGLSDERLVSEMYKDSDKSMSFQEFARQLGVDLQPKPWYQDTPALWGLEIVLLVGLILLLRRPQLLGRHAKPVLFGGLLIFLFLGFALLTGLRGTLQANLDTLGIGTSEVGVVVAVAYAAFGVACGVLGLAILRVGPPVPVPTGITKPSRVEATPPGPIEVAQAVQVAAEPGKVEPPPAADDDSLYARVADEVDGSERDRGLWTRLYVEHDGDETKVRVAYIRERVRALRSVAGD